MPETSWRGEVLARRAVGVVARRGLAVVLRLLAQEVADVLSAHAAAEVLAEAVRRAEAVLELTEERLVGDDLLRDELVLVAGALDVLRQRATPPSAGGSSEGSSLLANSFQTSLSVRVLVVGLGVVDVGREGLAQVRLELLALLVGELLDVDVQRLGP